MREDADATTDDDYHHKFSSEINTIYIYSAGASATLITSIDTNSQDLYEGTTPGVVLAEGNYTWSYSDDGEAEDGISSFLPFELEGEFRAYGQNIAVTADAESTASYFTIDKVVTTDSNGDWSGVAPKISKEGAANFFDLQDETDVLIHVGTGDDDLGVEYKSDYWYVYVDPSQKYDFEFYFDDKLGNADSLFTVENTTLDLNENFHYNCVFRVLVSDDANSDFGVVSVEFDENLWESKIVNVFVGGIDLKEVFEIADADYSADWPELLIVDADFGGLDSGIDKWHADGCGYIVTDGLTTLETLTVYSETSTDTLAVISAADFDAADGDIETQMVIAALKVAFDCGSYVINTRFCWC